MKDKADLHWLSIALDVPIADTFDYAHTEAVSVGTRVMLQFGSRQLIGVVIEELLQPRLEAEKVKLIDQVLDDLEPLSSDWLSLCRFAANYYQRPLGEVVLPSLPVLIRKASGYFSARTQIGPIARNDKKKSKVVSTPTTLIVSPELTEEQAQALKILNQASGFNCFLLHGVTGSGKTEVYLRYAQHVLKQGKQVLILVPEINLTPQLEMALKARLEALCGLGAVVTMHSRLSEGERLRSWLKVYRSEARVIIGTRLSIMLPIRELGLIVVDEEHDSSYKQQDGLRYSARDLAIWRAQQHAIPIVLGSATPSLETWYHSQQGRYRRLTLKKRAKKMRLPEIELVDTKTSSMQEGLSTRLLDEIKKRLIAKEQVLVFLNRRGYSPVLNCESCTWVSQCRRCSAYMVLHKEGNKHLLSCHHCGAHQRIPVACPDCGNQDLKPMGRGTQRLEEFLSLHFSQARVSRIDADSTKRKGSAEKLFTAVHQGEVDILIGTQMVAKGHDFDRLTCVIVLNADSMLYSQDFRAPERLFAQLMQVAGRAGRGRAGAKVFIQTNYVEHTLYQCLVKHDYERFASITLDERQQAGLPPYTFQALLTAEAKELKDALLFLETARDFIQSPEGSIYKEWLMIYDPVPLRIVKVANVERAQLLVESSHRKALQQFLPYWLAQVRVFAKEHKVRWQIEVDPLEI